MSTLLYLIYVNDLGNLPINGTIKGYADDTTILYEEFNEHQIQDDLRKLSEYFRINKLTLNINKSNFLYFSQSSQFDIPQIIFNGHTIKAVSHPRYLGLYLDKDLKFTEHIRNVCESTSKIVGVMYKVSHFLPKNVMRMIYMSMVHSRITYI